MYVCEFATTTTVPYHVPQTYRTCATHTYITCICMYVCMSCMYVQIMYESCVCTTHRLHVTLHTEQENYSVKGGHLHLYSTYM